MVCEADRDGKGQVAASWLLTQKEKGERMEPAARTLEPTQRERGQCSKEEELVGQGSVPSSLGHGGQWPNGAGDLPSQLL